jgi:hypothetical protein
VAKPRPSRISGQKILTDLRLAGRRGDRSALTLALDGMRTLAHSPRYWEKYLALLRNPSARLVDLLVIKQGEKIAHQKGWKKLGGGLDRSAVRASPSAPPSETSPRDRRRGQGSRSKRRTSARRRDAGSSQPSLFD